MKKQKVNAKTRQSFNLDLINDLSQALETI